MVAPKIYTVQNAFSDIAEVRGSVAHIQASGVDTWHLITVSLAAWANTASGYSLQYTKSFANSVWIVGDISGTAIAASPVTIGTLSDASLYSGIFQLPTPVSCMAGTLTGADTPSITIDTSGLVKLYFCQGATRVCINYHYSLLALLT